MPQLELELEVHEPLARAMRPQCPAEAHAIPHAAGASGPSQIVTVPGRAARGPGGASSEGQTDGVTDPPGINLGPARITGGG